MVNRRSLTKLTRRLLKAAQRQQLPNALGRALYATNRHYNGDCRTRRRSGYFEQATDAEMVRWATDETAMRWLEHWSNGGSLKALRYSAVEWNAKRRADEKAVKDLVAGL